MKLRLGRMEGISSKVRRSKVKKELAMQDFFFSSIDVLEKIAISELTPKPEGMLKGLVLLGKSELGITINMGVPTGFDCLKERRMEKPLVFKFEGGIRQGFGCDGPKGLGYGKKIFWEGDGLLGCENGAAKWNSPGLGLA